MAEPSCSPVFVVGCPRSGTTLLLNLLRSHPNLALTPESHFIPLLRESIGDPTGAREARRAAATILRLEWVRRWRLELEPSFFADCRSYAALVDRLYQAFAAREGKPRWGDKTPQYVTHLDHLHELFPHARFVHVIRDGRDVALSWIPQFFGPGNTLCAAHAWRHMVAAGRAAGRSLPAGSYLEVRFEELLEHPERVMRSVCGFLAEPYTPAVLQPNRLDVAIRRPIFGTGPRDHLRTPEIIRDNRSGWVTRMSARRRTVFESVAGDLLQELGYPRSCPARRIGSLERQFWTGHNILCWVFDQLNADRKRDWLATDARLLAARVRDRLRRRLARPGSPG